MGDLPRSDESNESVAELDVEPKAKHQDPTSYTLELPSFSDSDLVTSMDLSSSPRRGDKASASGSVPDLTISRQSGTPGLTFDCSVERQEAKRALAEFVDALTDDEIQRIGSFRPSRPAPGPPPSSARLSTDFIPVTKLSARLETVPEIVNVKKRGKKSEHVSTARPSADTRYANQSGLQEALMNPLSNLVEHHRLRQKAEEEIKIQERAASWARETERLVSQQVDNVVCEPPRCSNGIRLKSLRCNDHWGEDYPYGNNPDAHDKAAFSQPATTKDKDVPLFSKPPSLNEDANLSSPISTVSSIRPPIPVRIRPPMSMRSSDGANDQAPIFRSSADAIPRPLHVFKRGSKARGLQHQSSETALIRNESHKSQKMRFSLPSALAGYRRWKPERSGDSGGNLLNGEVRDDIAEADANNHADLDVLEGFEDYLAPANVPETTLGDAVEMSRKSSDALSRALSVPKVRVYQVDGSFTDMAVGSPRMTSWETDSPSVYSQSP